METKTVQRITFYNTILSLDWEQTKKEIYSKTASDVERALNKENPDIEDLKALVSPAAENYLETMALLSRNATQKRFGKTIQFYIPLYLSNECLNHCIYCGFNHNNKIRRIILSDEEILKEVNVIKSMGFEHILLLTGESPIHAGIDYIEHVMQLIRPHFKQISLEVQPLSTDEYLRLRNSGLYGVSVYQETYNRKRYPYYHPAGMKRDYRWRLETPERLGEAGVHKIGLGVLLGLEDWRIESIFLAQHLRYMERYYWKSKYSLSFPRMRPHEGSFQANFPLSDKQFVQMIWALRLFDNDIEMSMTTREERTFRNNMVSLGITSMSAGSKTEPGGYSQKTALEQFAVNDNRSPEEMLEMITEKGYEVVWKDWDNFK
ncbi:MAG: 2-iminoacetate synthase ThiH [Bacteroidales bacterium]|jgi:2-iminoacetate synthase|nr:2-iminoacetate synthase ThiH [Bacteroidales bacterium]